METLVFCPENREELKALKAFAEALEIPFEEIEMKSLARESGCFSKIKGFEYAMTQQLQEIVKYAKH